VTPGPGSVVDGMLTIPSTCPPATTACAARALLLDDHVHALLVTSGRRLLAVVERPDLDGVPDEVPARRIGGLAGRVVAADADLAEVWARMRAEGRRRLAVVDDAGDLLGLLCLKRSGQGFCTTEGVLARAHLRRTQPADVWATRV